MNSIRLQELWNYRELIYFFAWREMKVRYKQAVFGAAWAIMQPLAAMLIFTVIFGRLAKIPSDGLPYPLFSYTGLVLWTYFSSVVTHSSQSLISNSNLVTKVYFPRIALPASFAISGLADFFVSSGLVVVLMAIYRITPSAPLILAPVFLAGVILFTTGVSLLLAAVTVWYRDVKYTIPLLVQLWFFATPVIFPASFVPERYRPILFLNPMAGLVEGFRGCVLTDHWPDPGLTAISLTIAFATFAIGWVYFHHTERSFADVI
jgi:lipopolysaccharide transport system permease protein